MRRSSGIDLQRIDVDLQRIGVDLQRTDVDDSGGGGDD